MKTKYFNSFLLSAFLLIFLISIKVEAAKVVGRALAVKGDVKVTRAEEPQKKIKLRVRSRLYEKDVIETGDDSKVKILFNDESVMNISENARVEVVMQEKDEATKTNKSVYRLMKGKLRVLVGKISGEKTEYEVRTPTALAAVRGTQFFVWVENEKKTKVFVIDGVVEVENVEIPGVKVAVSEDLWTLVEAGVPPIEPRPIRMEDMKQLFQDTNIGGDKTVNPKMRRSFRAGGGGEGTGETGGGTEEGGTEGTGEVAGETRTTTGTGTEGAGGGEGVGGEEGEFAGEGAPEATGGGEGAGETGGGELGEPTGGIEAPTGEETPTGGEEFNEPPQQTPGEGGTGGKAPGQKGGVIEEKPKPKGKIIIRF
ncbi:MAG: hypothetical protein D6734_00615 [Candidatus Schekmanbacteria bacterium]|nr:MAG: hypothetical protein D6734_00615 [Candidatus Schekmanbacteria bacterium]